MGLDASVVWYSAQRWPSPEKYEIVGINDPFVDLDYMVYMTKYDSIPWPFQRRSKGRER